MQTYVYQLKSNINVILPSVNGIERVITEANYKLPQVIIKYDRKIFQMKTK